MTNSPPYDIRTWIYPNSGVNPIDPATWGLETDVSSFVRYPGGDGGQPITYSNGRPDEAANVDAGTLSLTFDNRDGRFCTKNMAGPYYGRLDRNTPIKVGMTGLVDTFTRSTSLGTVGTSDSGNNWTTTSANLQCNGTQLVANGMPTNNIMTAVSLDGGGQDMDIQVDVIPPAFTITGASLCSGIVARYLDNNNLWGARTEFNTAGDVTLKIFKFVAGSYSEPVAINPIPSTTYSQGVAWRLRVQVIGATIYAKTWPKASAEPSAWMLQATEPALMNGRQIGVNILRANGNTNTTGNTMVFDNFTSTAFEWTGTVVQWPTTWDMSGNNSWAPIQGAGILRRLNQGNGILQSPLRRQLSDLNKNPSGYWPMEDGSGASQLASALSQTDRNFPAIVSGGVAVAGDTGPAGGGTAVVISDVTGQVRGNTLVKTLPAGIKGFSAMIFTKFSSLPGSKQAICQWNGTGRAVKWVFSMDATTVYMDAYDNNGVNLSTAANTIAPQDPTKWVAWQLETDVVGSNTNWSFLSYQVGLPNSFYAQTGSFAYTGNSVIQSFLFNPNKVVSGVSIGHAWLGPNTLPFVDSTFAAVSSGYAGELASARATRIAGEEGIPILVEPGTSIAMGPQPSATALQVLQQCQDADQGILYEVGAGLGFRPGGGRYSPAVNLALTVASGHLSAAPEAIDDDQRVINSVTVTRTGGSSAVVTNDASIASIGLYDTSLSVNLNSDNSIAQLAAWKVYLGTYGALRWPSIALNLARIPGLPPIWRGKRYGMRMTIKSGLSQVTGADPDVIVEGWQATLWPHGWNANLNCSSAAPYSMPLVGDNALRVDADTSTVSSTFPNTNAMDLSTNQSDFLTDVSGFTPSSGCTLSWFLGGQTANDGSANLVASASPPSQVYFRNNTPVVVTAGNSYVITGWVFGGAVSNVSLSVDWATSGGVYLSTSAVNVTLPINTWTQFWGVVTAPATAARATYGPTIATPIANQSIFVDHLKFLDGAATQLTVDNGGNVSSTWVPTATYPAEVPFNIIVDGEVMTVHSCGNIFSTTKQILSVERSINTVNKAHSVGALVRLQTPSYLAL